MIPPPAAAGPSSGFVENSLPEQVVAPITINSATENNAKARPCRNVSIYGFCKKKDRGCMFDHSAESSITSMPPPGLGSGPNSVTTNYQSSHNHAYFSEVTPGPHSSNSNYIPAYLENSKPNFGDANSGFVALQQNDEQWYAPSDRMDGVDFSANERDKDGNMYYDDYLNPIPRSWMPGEHPGSLFYFSSFMHTPTQTTPPANMTETHLYYPLSAECSLSSTNAGQNQVTSSYFFISESSRAELACKLNNLRNPTICFTANHTIPESIYCYHSIEPLENGPPEISVVFGRKARWYRAINERNGNQHALLRILDYKLSHESLLSSVVEKWSKLSSPGVIALNEVFTTSAFETDSSLVFAYDYHGGAQTLAASFSGKLHPVDREHVRFAGAVLLQIALAIDSIHSLRLRAPKLDLSKVLVTGSNRVQISGLGVDDFLNPAQAMQPFLNSTPERNAIYNALGVFMVEVLCGRGAFEDIPNVLQSYLAKWPESIRAPINYLLTKSGSKTHAALMGHCAEISSNEIRDLQMKRDFTEDQLLRSIENGRIARLVMKLNFIVDHPALGMDDNWGEKGDRYLVKMFYNYTFHKIGISGIPILDAAHVVNCLNKLDAGSSEKISLCSSNAQNLMIVSYEEIKTCLEASFQELLSYST